MATEFCKRVLEESESEPQNTQKKKLNKLESCDKLSSFLEWSQKNGISLSKNVRVGKDGSCAQYGMIATSPISKGETLFTIDRSILLEPKTSSISDLLSNENANLESESGWVLLLIALMYEYNSASSKWRPYFDLCPDFEELDHILFWSREEVDGYLLGTSVPEAVLSDLAKINSEFDKIVLPFLNKNKSVFENMPICFDVNFYKKMVAFMMAYSFTDQHYDDEQTETSPDSVLNCGGSPSMVPMADILNHVADNNARLVFGDPCLKMIATRDIKENEEVFNTYGELSNWQLLQLYGFAEPYPNNFYDTVELSSDLLRSTLVEWSSEDKTLAEQKWNYLLEEDEASTTSAIVIGKDGILTEEETAPILNILCMEKPEFEKFLEESDINEEVSYSLDIDDIHELPLSWKTFLKCLISNKLKEYPFSLDKLETKIKTPISEVFTRRSKFSSYVAYGQQKLLHSFMSALL